MKKFFFEFDLVNLKSFIKSNGKFTISINIPLIPIPLVRKKFFVVELLNEFLYPFEIIVYVWPNLLNSFANNMISLYNPGWNLNPHKYILLIFNNIIIIS